MTTIPYLWYLKLQIWYFSIQGALSLSLSLSLSVSVSPPSVSGLQDSSSSVGSGEFTGIKELDDISQEIAQLQRYVRGFSPAPTARCRAGGEDSPQAPGNSVFLCGFDS